MLLPLPKTASSHGRGLPTAIRMGLGSPAAVPAALAAPLASSLGIHVWDRWEGSAFALNAFKCVVATALFGATLALRGINPMLSFSPSAMRMLVLSSFCGIIVGDLLWLRALQLLGAQDTIIMSALHPVIAWFAGTFILKQGSSASTVLGLLLVCTGVVYAQLFNCNSVTATAIESDNEEKSEELNVLKNRHMPNPKTKILSGREKRLLGCSLNLINIMLDVLASVLTRRIGTGHGTFEICFVRFGVASVGTAAIAAAAASLARVRGLGRPAWTALPDQSARAWASMGAGVVLVTYLSPALANYALFALPLAAWTALGSLGPVYSVPIQWIRERERPPANGMLGAAMASGGSAILGLTSH